MNNSPIPNIKIVLALLLLSRKEFRKFREFAEGRYFSGKRNYGKILDSLSKMHMKGFYGMTNSGMLKQLSGELGVSVRTLQSRMSELYSLFEKFLVNEFLQKNQLALDEQLLDSLLERSGFTLIEYITSRISRNNSSSKFDSRTLKSMINILSIKALTEFEKGRYTDFRSSMDRIPGYRTAEYVSSLLFHSLEHIQQLFFGAGKPGSPAEVALKNLNLGKSIELIKRTDELLYKYTLVYYHLYRTFSESSGHQDFLKARNYHKEIFERLSHRENQQLYFAFITYCINMTTLDKSEYYRTLFEIIDEKLRKGYDDELRQYNYPVNNFRDYVIIGLRVKETDWVKKFVSKYSHMIPEKFRDDEIRIARSRIAQADGRFSEALEYLDKVKKKNYLHYIDTNNLRLRSYYELGMTLDAFEEVDRLKQYIKNHEEIPRNLRKKSEEFMKDFRLLLRISDGREKPAEARFRLRKRNLATVTPWIRQKFEKLIG